MTDAHSCKNESYRELPAPIHGFASHAAKNSRSQITFRHSSSLYTLTYTVLFTLATQETPDFIGLSHLSRSETASGGGKLRSRPPTRDKEAESHPTPVNAT